MKENLPQIYKKNIFHTILCRIKGWFKKKNVSNSEITKNNTYIPIDEKDNFIDNVKVDIDTSAVNKKIEKAEFMEDLIDKPELLESFSNDRLEKILEYYREENDKKRVLVKKLSEG